MPWRAKTIPTLALGKAPSGFSRYDVESGTVLTLVEVYDESTDESARGYDTGIYYAYIADWESHTDRIETGPSAGVRLFFIAAQRGSRLPPSSRLALAAIVPEGWDDAAPESQMTTGLTNRP